MILFIRIPKNASTSLYASFGKQNAVNAHQEQFFRSVHHLPGWNLFSHPSHLNLEQVVKFLGKEVMDLLTVCCVRNPYDRIVSAYYFSNKTELWRVYGDVEPTFAEFANYYCDRVNDIDFAHGHTQTKWITYENELKADVILKFETLAEDFRIMNHKFGLDFELPHLNSTVHEDWPLYYNANIIERINEAYAEDFENFGYQKLGDNKK